MNMPMETASGRFLDLEKPHPDSVDIHDIAHHLSMICRFGGATCVFYSVAEHCVNTAFLAMSDNQSREVQFACLMHDAHEAYTGDMIRPAKNILKEYCQWERRIHDTVSYALLVPRDEFTEMLVKGYDDQMARIEARQLLRSKGCHWDHDDEDDDLNLQCWWPNDAKAHFMSAYERLAA